MASSYLSYSNQKKLFLEALIEYIDKTQKFTGLSGNALKTRILYEICNLFYPRAVKDLNDFYKTFPELYSYRNFFKKSSKKKK